MIRFCFDLTIPYRKRFPQKDYVEKTWVLSKNKSLEVQISKWGMGYTLIGLDFHIRPFQSHSGVFAEIQLLNMSLIINFFDNRHWNYSEGRWCKPGEDDE